MGKITSLKECFCYTCKKDFHYLGITRHRAAHRDRREDCTIEYTYGNVTTHRYSEIVIDRAVNKNNTDRHQETTYAEH